MDLPRHNTHMPIDRQDADEIDDTTELDMDRLQEHEPEEEEIIG